MNFFALAAYVPYTLCAGAFLAQEIALFDAQESRRIDTVEFGTKWFMVNVVALVVVLVIWGERFLASPNKSARDIDIGFSAYALILMLFRRCAWKMQLQNLKSNDLIMRLAVSILLLAAALAGFYYLDLKKAILWFLFLLVAYPPALAITCAPKIREKTALEMYKLGVQQIPLVGTLLARLLGGQASKPDPEPRAADNGDQKEKKSTSSK